MRVARRGKRQRRRARLATAADVLGHGETLESRTEGCLHTCFQWLRPVLVARLAGMFGQRLSKTFKLSLVIGGALLFARILITRFRVVRFDGPWRIGFGRRSA